MKNLILFIVAFFTSFAPVLAQKSWQVVDSIKADYEFYRYDQNGRFLTVNNNHIQLTLEKGTIFTSSLIGNSNVTCVDWDSALEPVFLLADDYRLMLLDNTLTAKNSGIKLSEEWELMSVSRSEQAFWGYTPNGNRLMKLAKDGSELLTTDNLSEFVDTSFVPKEMLCSGTQVFLNCQSTQGIMVLDQYGARLKILPIPSVTNLRRIGDFLFYLREGKIFRYHLFEFEESQLLEQYHSIESFDVSGTRLVLFKEKTFLFFVEK